MYEIKNLKEQLGAVVADLQGLADTAKTENRSFSAEELERWDALESRRNEIESQVKTQERIDKVQSLSVSVPHVVSTVSKRAITQQDVNDAFRAWAFRSSGMKHLIKREWEEAADRCRIDVNRPDLTLQLRTNNGQSTSDAYGGYTVEDGMIAGFERSMKAFGGIRNVANNINTATGGTINWPTVDDTANEAAIVGENVANTAVDIAFNVKQIGCYTYRTSAFPVSYELLQDSAINISDLVGSCLGERVARKTNTDFSVGDGTSKPEGVVTASTKGADADSTSGVSYQDLLDLYHSVDPAYRQNSVWMMNDLTIKSLESLVDEVGRPLWRNDLTSTSPGMLLGKPIVVNTAMANIANNAKSILFGDFSRHIIRNVAQVQLFTLNERYLDQYAIGFMGVYRGSCKLVNTSAVKHLLH
jgi:HK97 family phage major capsid protein